MAFQIQFSNGAHSLSFVVRILTGNLLQPGDFWCTTFCGGEPGRLVQVHGRDGEILHLISRARHNLNCLLTALTTSPVKNDFCIVFIYLLFFFYGYIDVIECNNKRVIYVYVIFRPHV